MDQLTVQAMAEFDSWSRKYDRSLLQRFLFRPSHELMLTHLRPTDRVILDVGCGTGVLANTLLTQDRADVVCGMDLSAQMLRKARGRLRRWADRFQGVRGDSEQLPFDDETFDVVTCSHSFHHYPDQAGVVAEMYRVLRPGGRLILVDGFRDRPYGWFIFDVMVEWAEGNVHHCSAREHGELFRGAGFRNVRQQRRSFPIPFVLTVGEARKVRAAEPAPLRKVA